MNIKDLFSLNNKVAVVTGATGYLGISICESLTEAGADVYITGKNKEKCETLANELQKHVSNKLYGLVMDISSSKSIKNCFKQIIKNSGTIDILVNNAVYGKNGNLETISENEWSSKIDGTINGVFRCTQAIIPIMKKNKSGTIINISSTYGEVSPDPTIYGDTGFNTPPNYAVGKAAINQFTRYAACHLAKEGIRVNTISPGPFPNTKVQKNKWFISNLERKTPLGKIGKPQDLKGVIVFLASQASSHITGENIHVDGGWTTW